MLARTRNLKILVTSDELETVKDLAQKTGLTVADYLRQLIRREEATTLGVKKKGRK